MMRLCSLPPLPLLASWPMPGAHSRSISYRLGTGTISSRAKSKGMETDPQVEVWIEMCLLGLVPHEQQRD